jgi:hypothetical protein
VKESDRKRGSDNVTRGCCLEAAIARSENDKRMTMSKRMIDQSIGQSINKLKDNFRVFYPTTIYLKRGNDIDLRC